MIMSEGLTWPPQVDPTLVLPADQPVAYGQETLPLEVRAPKSASQPLVSTRDTSRAA